MSKALTGKQRRYLRGLAHHLKPVVHVGNNGLSEGLITKVNDELQAHELIKIKVGENGPDDINSVGTDLAKQLRAYHAQTIGRIVVLYRRRDEEPEIQLPRD